MGGGDPLKKTYKSTHPSTQQSFSWPSNFYIIFMIHMCFFSVLQWQQESEPCPASPSVPLHAPVSMVHWPEHGGHDIRHRILQNLLWEGYHTREYMFIRPKTQLWFGHPLHGSSRLKSNQVKTNWTDAYSDIFF